MLLLTARAARQAAGQGDRQATAHRGDRRWVMAFRPHRDALGAASPGIAQALGVGRALEGEKTSLANEEAIGRKAQGGMMMKAAPAASFIMIEPKFLLEILIIPLNPPAQFGRVNQIDQGDRGRQGREPVPARLRVARPALPPE